jgi:hypothetical protein
MMMLNSRPEEELAHVQKGTGIEVHLYVLIRARAKWIRARALGVLCRVSTISTIIYHVPMGPSGLGSMLPRVESVTNYVDSIH